MIEDLKWDYWNVYYNIIGSDVVFDRDCVKVVLDKIVAVVTEKFDIPALILEGLEIKSLQEVRQIRIAFEQPFYFFYIFLLGR